MLTKLINAFLVEDKVELRATLVETMEEIAPLKFVGLADSEDSAAQWLQTHAGEWDLAIIDLFLAQGTGFGVLKKCQLRRPQQKVVVLTGYCQSNLRKRCRELGADAVFDKSQDVERLVDFCRDHARALAGSGSAPS